jgi:putative ubiquitin-RnfH superfamily antitoxin RatB of RatAB toxin-antitoxin module
MAEAALVQVTVLLAEAAVQGAVTLDLPAGTTAWQAVESSGLLRGRDDLDPRRLAVAIHGKQVPRGRELEAGDRVEILRPLPEDPKLRRRRAARAGTTLGRR